MKFMGTITLETDRLILRRLRADDACDMYENWANDEKVTRFLRWTPHKSVEESKNLLENFFICNYDDERYLAWGVELKKTGRLIGCITVSVNADDVGETGYALGEKYWGRGIVTEALSRIIKHCFEDIGMYRITAIHSVDNPASGRVMEKCGMKCEGFAKKAYRTGTGEVHDSKVYAITDDMYFGREHIGFDHLKSEAQSVTGYRTMSGNAAAGSMACAILTGKGNIYRGICVDSSDTSGLCACRSAISAMLTAGESVVEKMVVVDSRGTICPLCKKCRQLMLSISAENAKAEIMMGENQIAALSDLIHYNNGEAETVLESERLRLVPLTTDNISEVFTCFTQDITTYMFPAAAKDIGETEAFVNTTLDKMEKGREIVYAIRIKETDEFIGLGGIHNIKSGCPEIGIWTKKSSHGNGYGFETVSRLIAHIRECIPFDHILYPVDRRNYPSRRIPMLHGGKAMKEYNITNMSGDTLEIIEYWIK